MKSHSAKQRIEKIRSLLSEAGIPHRNCDDEILLLSKVIDDAKQKGQLARTISRKNKIRDAFKPADDADALENDPFLPMLESSVRFANLLQAIANLHGNQNECDEDLNYHLLESWSALGLKLVENILDKKTRERVFRPAFEDQTHLFLLSTLECSRAQKRRRKIVFACRVAVLIAESFRVMVWEKFSRVVSKLIPSEAKRWLS